MLNQVGDSAIAGNSFCDTYSHPNMDQKDILLKHIAMLSERNKEKTLLIFACGDWYVRLLSENEARLPANCINPYIPVDLMDRIVPKDLFYGLCEKLEIPYPETFVYDVKERTPLKEFTYPIAVKPSDSAQYHYALFDGKKKAYIIHSKEELLTMLNHLHESSYKEKLLIQDYIPGGDDHMRVLTCYSDRQAKVRFASFGHVLLEEHTPSAVGNPCCVISDENEEVVKQATKFLEHVGYTGISNFDLKYDERDGKYKFFEINTRQGRSNYYVTANGYNLMDYFVKDFITKEDMGYTVTKGNHLFTFVPPYVMKHYIDDPENMKKAMKLYREGKWSNPLFSKDEESLRMKVYARIAFFNQIIKFKRHGKRVR